MKLYFLIKYLFWVHKSLIEGKTHPSSNAYLRIHRVYAEILTNHLSMGEPKNRIRVMTIY